MKFFLKFQNFQINKYPKKFNLKNQNLPTKFVNFGIFRPFGIPHDSQLCQFLYLPFDTNQFRRFNFSIFISYFSDSGKFVSHSKIVLWNFNPYRYIFITRIHIAETLYNSNSRECLDGVRIYIYPKLLNVSSHANLNFECSSVVPVRYWTRSPLFIRLPGAQLYNVCLGVLQSIKIRLKAQQAWP